MYRPLTYALNRDSSLRHYTNRTVAWSRMRIGHRCLICLGLAIVAMSARTVYAGPPPDPPSATYCHVTSDGTDATKTPADLIWAPSGLNVHDMTLDGSDADDCFGIVGGNLPEASGFSFDGTTYTFAAKSSDASKGSAINGIDFGVTATGVTGGDWTLTWADINAGAPLNLPTYFDLVVGLKAGNNYAVYLFDDVLLSTTGAGSGTFEISFRNFQGNVNGLSHLNVYAVHEDTPPSPPLGRTVPEPATLALLGLGLAGLGFSRRRKLN